MPVTLNPSDQPISPVARRDVADPQAERNDAVHRPPGAMSARPADRIEKSPAPVPDLRAAAEAAAAGARAPGAAERTVAGAGTTTDAATEALRAGQKLSGGQPPIELDHVFEGEVSPRRGTDVAKGFHHAPNDGVHPNARVVQELSPRNANGVYEARVEITKPQTGATYQKRSTMFPDSMSRDVIVRSLQHAYDNATQKSANAFVGPSGHGFDVQGYTSGSGAGLHIRTGFPVYTP